MAGKSNPFDELEELFDRMTRQFETAARAWDVENAAPFERSTEGSSVGLDLADEGDAFVVTVDVPGYETDDLDVRLTGETLRVSGERERTVEDEGREYVRRERRTDSFSRQVRLPEPADPDDVEARLRNGVLTLRIPKVEPGEGARSIDIQ